MPRLPQPGGDVGQWGNLLNEYLQVSHNDNGTLKDSAVSSSKVQDGAITAAKISTTNAPTSGQSLTYNGTGLAWSVVSGSDATPDATTSTKGSLQLSGDLAGTASSPTVPGLATKEPLISEGTSQQYYRGDKTWQTLNKATVGLADVDNTADVAKPISTATQTALNTKADTTHVHSGADITTGTIESARLPQSTDTSAGVVELATVAETQAGTDTTRAVTAAGVKATVDAAVESAVEALPQPEILFVNSLGDIPPGTPVDTLVVVRAA